MRIGIEAQRLFRKRKHGMEVVALETIKELQKLSPNHEIMVFVKQDQDVCITSTNSCELVELPSASYPVWEQISLRKALKYYDIDLLHCTANTAPLFLKTNLVLTLHDIIYFESISFLGSSYQNFGNLYRRFIVPKVVDNCSCIITVSQFEKERISETLNINPEKIRVVYNAINPNFQVYGNKTLEETRKKYKLPEKFVLHFGNTAPKKNTIGALKAFAEIKRNTQHDDLFLVITDCKDPFIDEILKTINAKEVKKYIKVIDHVNFNEIPFIYNLATVFMYPSLRESFGMPILESMACGTPVVTSSTSSMPEIAGDAALLSDPFDYIQIASSINRYLNNSDLYQKKREGGFRQARKFNWTNSAKEVLSIYNEISV
ncbi:glycosyltransferase family 4 protein [Chondrinema litorale]|uniref:glycosyltransferase family 4 protein n=1 Tax=Chondrinema litorale TaxID=2994555 RepID=UPI0025427F8A|nr:glycosyltransferase family 1 protein [Chondrinema litorale]UZS00108.1 glycosyltransferase family 1 protein [Chondrinema litorale]